MAIPSLILKRSRKPQGAFHSLDSLRQFVTTEDGKRTWDDLMTNGDWDGDVIVFDEAMNEKDRPSHNILSNNSSTSTMQSAAWSIMELISPLLRYGSVDYLEGGLASARRHPYLCQLIVSRSDSDDSYSFSHQNDSLLLSAPGNSSKKASSGIGLFQLDTLTASKSKTFPEVEQLTPSSRPPPKQSTMQTWSVVEDYATPSPPPSSTVFTRQHSLRRPSIPALRRLDTASTERLNANLPKLQVRAVPSKSTSLALPKTNPNHTSSLRSRSRSPSHLNLVVSTHSPPNSARLPLPDGRISKPNELLLPPPSPSQPRTPLTPGTPLPPSPSTARPDTATADAPPTTEDPFPAFSISTILPGFLFLGPEPTTEEHVEELLEKGVRRIVNLAIECDDVNGLGLKERFEKYVRIPMRDTVEEDNITRGVREVCTILGVFGRFTYIPYSLTELLIDDARLHSAPSYVHCKAGKSRSVTAVMAYLIHANHWTLSRAYAFVVGRRKGISPNIGFVSELMTFEEQELGGKSIGVVKMPQKDVEGEDKGNGGEGEGMGGGGGAGMQGSYQVAIGGNRRGQHVRESLPPAFSFSFSLPVQQEHPTDSNNDLSDNSNNNSNLLMRMRGPPLMSGGDVAQLGDAQQELEIKDAEGRYRHARRAPVDEATLQPMRRVSKAGLESSVYGEMRG